jgi:hypothetical protein
MQKQISKTTAFCGGCNRHLIVPDNFTAPRGRCPRCGELVVNPKGELSRKNMEYLLKDRIDLSRLIEIRYDELTLFLLSSALLITALANIGAIVKLCTNSPQITLGLISGFFVIFGLFVVTYIIGFCFSLYHVFTKRLKSLSDKGAMLLFAVITNSVSGIAASYYMYIDSVWRDKWYLGIFPLWVFLNSFFLLIKLRNCPYEKFDDIIVDDNASLGQIISALMVLLIVFGLCHFVFKLNWSITLSISVAYATGFSKAFRELIPAKIPMADKTGE